MNLKQLFESLYLKFNKKEFVNPDPLIFLYDYENIKDREIIGLIASTLAYGRVAQILASVKKIVEPMGKSPYDFVMSHKKRELEKKYDGFKHRFTVSDEIVNLLTGIKSGIAEYKNLENLYLSGVDNFVKFLNNSQKSYLLPAPADGSACKRLNLYFRWMIRKDEVDPGGWDKCSKKELLIPLDTHMFKIAKMVQFTKRNSADFKAVKEITERFAEISPDDPVKYDFSLTRLGIRDDASFDELTSFLKQNQLNSF
ncbi:MAG: TIGR02757 family protein [bacterium]